MRGMRGASREAGMDLSMDNRILKFLGQGPANVSALANADRLLLERADDRRLAVEQSVIAGLARRGLVERRAGSLQLTALGRAAVARLTPGDNRFGAQHRDLEAKEFVEGESRIVATVNANESPLAALARRKSRNGEAFLSDSEFLAGERLRADYTRSQIMPSVTSNWDMTGRRRRGEGSAGGIDLTDAALSARRRVETALDIVGPEMAGVLVDVCCFLKGLETVESERGWPVRSAKLVLKFALAALGRHYNPPRAGHARSRHWGTADYRPVSAFGQAGR